MYIFVCLLRRRHKSRSRRRIKYAILAHKDGEENGEALQMLPRGWQLSVHLFVCHVWFFNLYIYDGLIITCDNVM